ncbi:S8 family serine peptidase [Paenibacillus turicensis]|uniref:S8 family serine peptidase n=1 Tax=Paenibacillus turicensis TaxID=160487 RepID=UPI003D2C5B9B
MTIQVAIIDNGVNPYFISSYFNSYEVKQGKVYSISNHSSQNELTHGTICAAIFCNYTSNHEIHSLQIMQFDQRKTNVNDLVTALTWCLTNHIQLIHLSLGSIYFGDFEAINQIISKLLSHNVIIVAACNNKNVTTIPASLPGVIGVRCDPLGQLGEGQFFYNDTSIHNIEIISSCDYTLMNEKLVNAIVKCNSFAAPFISATVCNIIQQGFYDIDSIKDSLQRKSVESHHIYTFDYYERCLDSSNIIDVPIVTMIDDTNNLARGLLIELIKYFQSDGYHCIGITPYKSDITMQIYQMKNYWSESAFDLWATVRMIYYTTLCDVIIMQIKDEDELWELQQQGIVDLLVQTTEGGEGQKQPLSLHCDLPVVSFHTCDYTANNLLSISRDLYTKIFKELDKS